MSVDESWLDRYRDEFLRRFGANASAPRAGSAGPVGATESTQAPTPPPGQEFVPNYLQILQSDPSYLDWLNNATLDINQAGAARGAALKALVMRYGGMGGLKDAYGDIDQPTLDLAAANPYSDTARIKRGYEQGVEQYKRNLAGRRMLKSGELQYGLDQADYGRAATEYDLAQEYANAYQTAINNYLGVENAYRRSQAGAIQGAVDRGAPIYQPTKPPGDSTGGPGSTTTTTTAPTATTTSEPATSTYDPFLKRYTQEFF